MVYEIEGKTFWGFAETLPGGTASRIKVYGEKKNDVYKKYPPESSKDRFPPIGKVFVHQAISSYYTFQAESHTRKKENDDEYLALYQSLKMIKFSRLLSIKQLENSSIFPFDEIQNIGQEKEEGTYFIKNIETNEMMGPFRKDSKGLSPLIGKEVSVYEIPDNFNDYLFDNDKLLFTTADSNFKKTRQIDCMSNEQLQEWFREKIKEAKEFTDKDTAIADALLKQIKILPIFSANALDDIRYKRVAECLINYDYSYDELKNLFIKDGFEIFSKKIDDMRAEIRDEYESTLLKNLEDLEKEKKIFEDNTDPAILI